MDDVHPAPACPSEPRSGHSPGEGGSEAGAPLVELAEITKTYTRGGAPLAALRQVSLSVAQGEFVAVMGTSGSGKSTLLNVLGLLDRPSSGRYLLRGHEVGCLGERDRTRLRREQLGFVFQSFNLYPRKTALANVAMPLVFAGVRPRERRRRASALLEQVGLADRLRHRPHELSGGQQQRVAIARALVNGPALVLADEPTGNLDVATGEAVMALLRDLNRSGTTIVMVTHDELVARYAQRIVRLSDGWVVSDEPVDDPEDAERDHVSGGPLREVQHAGR